MSFQNFIDTLLEKMKTTIKTESVVGDPITVGDITIVPIAKVTFGFGAGGEDLDKNKGFGGGSGGGATITPIGFLIVKNGEVSLVPVHEKETLFDKLIDPASYDKLEKVFDKLKDKVKKEIRKSKKAENDQTGDNN